MKRKIRVILLIIAALLLAGAYWVYFSFNGSILKRIATTVKAREYVEKTYPGEPYETRFCRYDFKAMGYFCTVQSRESEDTRFTVWSGQDGLQDDFEWRVDGRQNTVLRLQQALDAYTEEQLKKIYPHRTLLVLCDISDQVTEKEMRALPLDMSFDPDNFPLPVTLTVWTETEREAPDWQELEERFYELDALVKDEMPEIRTYSLCLQDQYVLENGELTQQDYNVQICAYDVPAEVIRDGDLKTYLEQEKAAQEAEQEAMENGEAAGKDE